MTAADGGAVSLFSTLAVKGALDVLLPEFEARSGVRVDATFRPTTLLMEEIGQGARPDVVVAVSSSIADLAEAGVVARASITPVAASGIGVAVARGVAAPDIGTVDALVATLTAARSVAYSQTGASGRYFAQLIDELGVAATVNSRATVITSGFTAEAVIDGRADIAVQMLSELRPYVPAVAIVGPLPREVQRETVFAVGLGVGATEKSPATRLAAALSSVAATEAYVGAGLTTA